MNYKVFDEDSFAHFMTKLKDSLDSKQSIIGYSPVNKAGDTMSGDLIILASLKSQSSIYEAGEKLADKYGSKSIVSDTANTVANLVGQIAGIEISLGELGDLSEIDLAEINKTTTFLRGDGTWAKPKDTTYSAGSGISFSGTKINHTNSIVEGSFGEGGATRKLKFGGNFNVPTVSYDSEGHIKEKSIITLTLPDLVDEDTIYHAGTGLDLDDITKTFSVQDIYGSKTVLNKAVSDLSAVSSNLAAISETVGGLGNVSAINKNNNAATYLSGAGKWTVPKNDTYKSGRGLSLDASTNTFSANIATKQALGSIIAGAGISIDSAGKISVSTDYVPNSHAAEIGNGGHIPPIGTAGQFLAHNGVWAVPTNTKYKGSENITLGTGNAFDLSSIFLDSFENIRSLAQSASDDIGNLKDLAWKSLPAGLSPSVFLDGSGNWSIPNDTKYSAGTGLALNGTTFSVKDEYVKKAGDNMTGPLVLGGRFKVVYNDIEDSLDFEVI